MTNYIEGMMKTAGVMPIYEYTVKGQTTVLKVDKEWLVWKFKGRKNKSVFKVVKIDKTYPDFTAEKQIEIIKLLNVTRDFHCVNNALSALTEDGDEIEVHGKDFTQALAQLTTKLINAGELDKQKVKEILE